MATSLTGRVGGGASADHSKRVPAQGGHAAVFGVLGGSTWGNAWGFFGVQPSSSWGSTWATLSGGTAVVEAKPGPFNTGRVSVAPASSVTKRVSG